MTHPTPIERPQTLREVAEWSESLSDFGMNLRDWQHAVQRGGIHSRTELSRRLADPPPLLANQFPQGDMADAYLAAYAEWLADRAAIPRPDWSSESDRVAHDPWFSAPTHALLLVTSPASFRQRNLFTKPESVFTPKAGRPRVPLSQKREKARQRQKAYRQRIGKLVKQARRSAPPKRPEASTH